MSGINTDGDAGSVSSDSISFFRGITSLPSTILVTTNWKGTGAMSDFFLSGVMLLCVSLALYQATPKAVRQIQEHVSSR